MEQTRLILVGGFLGAGKTTLLWETASRIMATGKRIGLVTNDQAPELVDTALLLYKNIKVAEVSGSCFCCNFNGLIDALSKVKSEAQADVIIAEPVGSCTDLSATIVQPLKKNMSSELLVSPLSVLAEPDRLSDILNGGTAGLHPSAAYIFRKQLEESEIILISKSDLINSTELKELKMKVKERFPESEVMSISNKTGDGIEEWLQEVMTRIDSGKRLVDVDYDVYAEGEAVLGWLNTTIELTADEATDWDKFGYKLLAVLKSRFEKLKASIGHVKILLETGGKYMTGNLTGKNGNLETNGSCGKTEKVLLTLNARVEIPPKMLEQVVREILKNETANIKLREIAWRCLSPGRPQPTYRFDHIVPASLLH